MKYILRFRFLLRTSDSCFEYESFISAGAWKIKEINKQIDSQWSTQNKMHSVTNYKTLNKNSSGTITSFQLKLKTKCNMNEPVELTDGGHTVRSESVWGPLMQINCEQASCVHLLHWLLHCVYDSIETTCSRVSCGLLLYHKLALVQDVYHNTPSLRI